MRANTLLSYSAWQLQQLEGDTERKREMESLKQDLHAAHESNRWLQNLLDERNRELLVSIKSCD